MSVFSTVFCQNVTMSTPTCWANDLVRVSRINTAITPIMLPIVPTNVPIEVINAVYASAVASGLTGTTAGIIVAL